MVDPRTNIDGLHEYMLESDAKLVITIDLAYPAIAKAIRETAVNHFCFADTPIVPVVLEYDREHKQCQVRFGEPMTFAQETNKLAAIEKLRDTMASMRWEFWERKGIFRRAELHMDTERKKLFYSIEEYPPIDWEYESSCIFNRHTEPKDAFFYPDRLITSWENTVLLRRNS